MKPAIVIEDLGKRYRLGRHASYGRLTESVSQSARRLLTRDQNEQANQRDYLWALRHVNLEIAEGEVMGVIGHNGAGKTTLLKILSRITEPTEGRAQFRGLVGSLLEVGTGFHPELTGRENVFLNGAVLGMPRSDVRRKFDEIVEFAGIGRFLDTPVKRYSSGMYVRLAFSVAAQLEPDILVVDEVLAVGDIEFQRRCIGKMGDVAREGRTVLFVSHNTGAVTHLCQRVAWFERGEIMDVGPAQRVVERYLTATGGLEGKRVWPEGARLPGVRELSVRGVQIATPGGVTSVVDMRRPFRIEIDFEIHEPIGGVAIGGVLRRLDGVTVFEAYDTDVPGSPTRRSRGVHTASCEIPGGLLNEGRYSFTVYCFTPGGSLAHIEDALTFDVVDLGAPGLDIAATQQREGVVRPQLSWIHSADTGDRQ